jgi:hypothetical protein
MRRAVKTFRLVILLCILPFATALAAESTRPSADPGEEIKEGAVTFGHGIRDGAIKAWGAVRSIFDDGGGTSDKRKESSPPPKNSGDAPDRK